MLVKASYFPNWKADGADGPWRIGPNLMVVVPTANHVELGYGRTGIDWLATLLTLGGVAGVVGLRLNVLYGGGIGFEDVQRGRTFAGQSARAAHRVRELEVNLPGLISQVPRVCVQNDRVERVSHQTPHHRIRRLTTPAVQVDVAQRDTCFGTI